MKLIGMNCELMKRYIEFVADRLMLELGFTKVTCTLRTYGANFRARCHWWVGVGSKSKETAILNVATG